jgi:hypothetical protein
VSVFRNITAITEGSSSGIVSSKASSGSILSSPTISSGPHVSSSPLVTTTSGLQHFGWDLYLLIVSLALVWIGSRGHVRGLGYVGGAGLLAFILSIGAQITRLQSGRPPTADIVGWPLALLIVGVVGLAAPALYRRGGA